MIDKQLTSLREQSITAANTGNRCTTLYFSKESLKPKKLNLF